MIPEPTSPVMPTPEQLEQWANWLRTVKDGTKFQQQQDAAVATENQDFTAIAARLQEPLTIRLLHAAMGLATETGEIHDALKRWIFYGKELDFVNLLEEGGDVSWYLRVLADALKEFVAGKCSFEEMIDRNIAKLKARFPDKFTEHHAINRDIEKERVILENGGEPLTHEEQTGLKRAIEGLRPEPKWTTPPTMNRVDPNTLESRWDIWDADGVLHVQIMANSFQEACDKHFQNNASYDSKKQTFYGYKLAPTKEQAEQFKPE